MMKKRCTLGFKSLNGNEYIYDDASSMIFPWGKMEEKILNALEKGKNCYDSLVSNYNSKTLKNGIDKIAFWKENMGAFYQDDCIEVPNTCDDIVKFIGDNLTRQLILSVTDDCNLRCKYCIYSDTYQLTKNKSNKYMTIEIAQKAIDYFYNLIKNQLIKNPRKKIGITFYGGEPLMNMKTVKYSVSYIRQLFGESAYFMMTSNGLLLNDENIKFLVENDVGLAISLDGPQCEHDRLRIRVDGSGSFEKIIQNICNIKNSYPEYFRKRVNAVCVFDPKTNIEIVEEYYEMLEKTYDIPRAIFVNKVSNNGTNYYDDFTEQDNVVFNEKINALTQKYFIKKINNQNSSSYLSSIAGGGPMSILIRRRFDESNRLFVQASGACIPGQKICVNSSGDLDICERVNGHNTIGNVSNGIEKEKIIKIITDYNKTALKHCKTCPIKKICGLCYLNFETSSGFHENRECCKNHIKTVRNNLTTYVSIREEKPDCSFIFSSDTIELAIENM